jgi:hypothetical protein
MVNQIKLIIVSFYHVKQKKGHSVAAITFYFIRRKHKETYPTCMTIASSFHEGDRVDPTAISSEARARYPPSLPDVLTHNCGRRALAE